jgi:hypothetical protein
MPVVYQDQSTCDAAAAASSATHARCFHIQGTEDGKPHMGAYAAAITGWQKQGYK